MNDQLQDGPAWMYQQQMRGQRPQNMQQQQPGAPQYPPQQPMSPGYPPQQSMPPQQPPQWPNNVPPLPGQYAPSRGWDYQQQPQQMPGPQMQQMHSQPTPQMQNPQMQYPPQQPMPGYPQQMQVPSPQMPVQQQPMQQRPAPPAQPQVAPLTPKLKKIINVFLVLVTLTLVLFLGSAVYYYVKFVR